MGVEAVVPVDGSWAFFPFIRLLLHRGDPRLTRLEGGPGPNRGVPHLVRGAASHVAVLMRFGTHAVLRDLVTSTTRPATRPLDRRVVVHPESLSQNLLASSLVPGLRVGQARQPLVLVDGHRAVVRDPVGDDWWVTADHDLFTLAQRTFDAVWEASSPALDPGRPPPFTPRMLHLADLLLRGATDRAIARELRVSERTVSAEVRELTRRLGATTRAHAVARISGV
jgi:DNA-binding CsgD family transcriptional regulator